MPKVSIIIPVYNSESTLRRCLDSVLAQTFTDFECLLINDGSTDRSGEICDEYARMDSRVKVFHKENGGVSSARECGLLHACGLYIIQFDSDDWVEPDMLKDLYLRIQKDNSDMVICDYFDEEIDGSFVNVQSPTSLEPSILLRDLFKKLHGGCWNKLVKRELFNRYNLHFPQGLNVGEDLFINVSLLLHDIKISYINKAYYHYDHFANASSITNKLCDWSQVYQEQVKYFEPLLEERYPDMVDYLRFLAKRECFIKGLSYRIFMNTCSEINGKLSTLCKGAPSGKAIFIASRNIFLYVIIRFLRKLYLKIIGGAK